MQPQKRHNHFSLFPSQTVQHPVIQVYASSTDAEETKVDQFCDDLQQLLEQTLKNVRFSSWGTGIKH